MKCELWFTGTCSQFGKIKVPTHLLLGTYTSWEELKKAIKYRHDQLGDVEIDDRYYVKAYE